MQVQTARTITSELLTTKEACSYLNVSRWTLARWARAVRARRVKRGRLVRWPRQQLDLMAERATREMR